MPRGRLLWLALWWLLPATAAQGQASATVQRYEIQYQFGQSLSFTLEATATEPISGATLLFSAPTMPNSFSAEVVLAPGTRVQSGYQVDLSQVRLAPFSPVTYRWVLTTEAGETIVLPEQSFRYEDDRFAWQELASAGIVVHWAEGNARLGQEAVDTLVNVLPDLQAIVPAAPPTPLHVYLYPTASDLQAALRLAGQSRLGGHASPELGVILVAIEDPVTAAAELGRLLPHELTHLLLAAATGSAYQKMPVWLNEGLASAMEVTPSGSYAALLATAMAANTVIPFRDLCLAFPTSEGAAALAYAQSADLVRYLRDTYGNHVLTEMVEAVADGAGCESTVQRVLGISLNELNEDWWRARIPMSPWRRLIVDNVGWLLLISGGFSLVILAQLRQGGRRREGDPS